MTKARWLRTRVGPACLAGALLVAGAALSQEEAAEPADAAPGPEAAAGAGPAAAGEVEPAAGAEEVADAGSDAGAEDAPEDAAEPHGDMAALMAAGEAGYLANCRPCHGTNGTAGVPLAGNKKVEAGPDYLGWAILTGPGYMPEFHEALTDQQIAEISTYILNSGGNEYGEVFAEDIEFLR